MVFDDQSNNYNIDVILDVENYVLNKESKKIHKEIRFIVKLYQVDFDKVTYTYLL